MQAAGPGLPDDDPQHTEVDTASLYRQQDLSLKASPPTPPVCG